jgi:hypothetical protein
MTQFDRILILVLILIGGSLLVYKQFAPHPAVRTVEARLNGEVILKVGYTFYENQ